MAASAPIDEDDDYYAVLNVPRDVSFATGNGKGPCLPPFSLVSVASFTALSLSLFALYLATSVVIF